jgi:hypothetical protein
MLTSAQSRAPSYHQSIWVGKLILSSNDFNIKSDTNSRLYSIHFHSQMLMIAYPGYIIVPYKHGDYISHKSRTLYSTALSRSSTSVNYNSRKVGLFGKITPTAMDKVYMFNVGWIPKPWWSMSGNIAVVADFRHAWTPIRTNDRMISQCFHGCLANSLHNYYFVYLVGTEKNR